VSYAEASEQKPENEERQEVVVAELVPGGEKDSVVYLGKSSFKMKVGVRTTPPAETSLTVPPSPRVTQPPSHVTPPPVKTSSPYVTPPR
jgi:hypothetical protein